MISLYTAYNLHCVSLCFGVMLGIVIERFALLDFFAIKKENYLQFSERK
ncbi:MAG: hypothetical protein ACJAU0_000126 [Flavobacteriales bacterium]|jgi:hypothetical protein